MVGGEDDISRSDLAMRGTGALRMFQQHLLREETWWAELPVPGSFLSTRDSLQGMLAALGKCWPPPPPPIACWKEGQKRRPQGCAQRVDTRHPVR